MTIKLIVVDLDGVIIDSRELHYLALNKALEEISSDYVISKEEHLAKYDGHPTKYKLNLLTKEKGLDPSLYDRVWKRKQDLTQDVILQTFTLDNRIIEIFMSLKHQGYTIFCASNSIWITVKNALLTKGFLPFIDFFISNEEVKSPKPNPDIYFRCFERANVTPKETMICEDSPVGRKAAFSSGAYVCPIENVADFSLEKILFYINKFNRMDKYAPSLETSAKKVNIVIPAAGLGSRFANAGYTFPKPLIDVNGKPMIQVVVENIGIMGHYIFIVQKEHYEKYNMKYLLNLIAPNCDIVITEGVTEGAACSILLAKALINNDDPLIIANSDQFLEWDSHSFLYTSMSEGVDGCISTFTNTHPKFSYAKIDDEGFVTEVAEKVPISDIATTGIYFWKKGEDFVKYAEQMITKNIRVNNEFYVAPVYNQAIESGLKIKTDSCKKFLCLGTPEDLQYFLQQHCKS
jgi:beta-phosphoglucomutase-like phosphatase (HAD superfamily)/dTDP-glucose pyrophosphorylase